MSSLTGDTVVMQDWLMKRSQVTRVFRRRFSMLTANGRLYSFRRIDLSRPGSFAPATASLVWDIRGCIVELAPKFGRNTWVLRPSGSSSSLKEDIYLRTCDLTPESSAHHWIAIMAAVSKHRLNSLVEGVPFLTVKAVFPSEFEAAYARLEGSLYYLTPKEQANGYTEYSTVLPVRSGDPGTCVTIETFTSESGGETPETVSELIPRYLFHKENSSLPWSHGTAREVVLRAQTSGNVVYRGSLFISISEGFRDYLKPVISQELEGPAGVDFGLFKFQIKRLIRIIDAIGEMKDGISEILEWDNSKLSLACLVYSSVVLLLMPHFVPIILILHIVHASLLNSREFASLWNGLFLVQTTRSLLGMSPQRALTTELSPVEGEKPIVPTPATPPDAPASMIQQVSTALSSNRGSSSVLKSEIWENQRRNLGGSQFSASNLSVFDRSRWSDSTGKVALDPPTSSDWKIDVDSTHSDENGWTYSTRWGGSDWHAGFTSWDFVRRRRWVPRAMTQTGGPLSPPVMAYTSPGSPVSPALGSTSEGYDDVYLASLSSVPTNTAEFGSIQADYDDSNAEHQPRQAGLGSMFNEFKSTAARAQSEIGDICTSAERIVALFTWRDEMISALAIGALLVAVVVLRFVPLNYICLATILSLFQVGYRRNKWRMVAVECVVRQHINVLIPSDGDPSHLGGLEAHRLCLALSRRTGVNVSQKALSELHSKCDIAKWICKQGPVFSKTRPWTKRDWIENLMDHIPPLVSTERQAFFSDSVILQKSSEPRLPDISGTSTPEGKEEASLISETL